MGSRYLATREVMAQTSGFFFAVVMLVWREAIWEEGKRGKGKRERREGMLCEILSDNESY